MSAFLHIKPMAVILVSIGPGISHEFCLLMKGKRLEHRIKGRIKRARTNDTISFQLYHFIHYHHTKKTKFMGARLLQVGCRH